MTSYESTALVSGGGYIENLEECQTCTCVRSCDSSFGLSSLSNEDELCWFSSSHATEVSKDALRSGNKLVGLTASALKISECDEVSQPKSAGLPINDSNRKSVSTSDQTKSQTSHNEKPDMYTESRDNLMHKEQINVHLKQSKNLKQRERRSKEKEEEKIDIWEMLVLFTIAVNMMIWSTAMEINCLFLLQEFINITKT